ncbi:NKAP domain containing 1 [Pleuronectes platessa]|uniref:NKAP domain containing 1 n=1 Tax=Pleuronectes platessa TaxID=8262 RepID=UPI00232A4DF2|nr:NKAP domain containing 1 [Pleuronectes platessa]
MSYQPLGKTLLRNVIRHTDAHNKIQEEQEMWKMRGWQVQRTDPKQSSDTVSSRGQMHCDRGADQTGDLRRSRERVSEHDDREARYWTRKLYEFEAKDPDRWGHSGFKELYPEEFKRDKSTKKLERHKRKKSKSDTEGSLSRHSKKSSRKTKKKKKKKDEDAGRKKAKCPSSSDSSGDGSSHKDKHGRKRTKSRHKDKKSSKTRGRDDDSSSGGSDDGERKRRTHSRKKRKQDFHKDAESGLNSTKKRKNWKAAGERSSADSSAD